MYALQVRLPGAVEATDRMGQLRYLLVVVLVLLDFPSLQASDVLPRNETVTNTVTVTSFDGSIYAGQGYTINPPGNVTFRAYAEIDLKSGFTAALGSTFRAYLIGTENDPNVRYFNVTGTVTLNGAGAGNVPVTIYGYNSYGRWVSETAVTDSQGSFTLNVPEGTYAINEQGDAHIFKLGEIGYIQVAGANITISPESTILIPTDTHLTYYHNDAIGNAIAETSDNGAVIMRSTFYPFGDLYSTEGVGERYLFTGKERDTTGLDFFGARYYEPSIGRFSGIDPLTGKMDNPQSWNRYAYCLNNPYKYLDPTGKDEDKLNKEKDKEEKKKQDEEAKKEQEIIKDLNKTAITLCVVGQADPLPAEEIIAGMIFTGAIAYQNKDVIVGSIKDIQKAVEEAKKQLAQAQNEIRTPWQPPMKEFDPNDPPPSNASRWRKIGYAVSRTIKLISGLIDK